MRQEPRDLMPVRLRFHDRAKFRRVFDASLKRDSNWMGLPIGLVLVVRRKRAIFHFLPARDVSHYLASTDTFSPLRFFSSINSLNNVSPNVHVTVFVTVKAFRAIPSPTPSLGSHFLEGASRSLAIIELRERFRNTEFWLLV